MEFLCCLVAKGSGGGGCDPAGDFRDCFGLPVTGETSLKFLYRLVAKRVLVVAVTQWVISEIAAVCLRRAKHRQSLPPMKFLCHLVVKLVSAVIQRMIRHPAMQQQKRRVLLEAGVTLRDLCWIDVGIAQLSDGTRVILPSGFCRWVGL
jgi:hypothetical protein